MGNSDVQSHCTSFFIKSQYVFIRITLEIIIYMRHLEISQLHPSVAKWLQKQHFIYEYECWLNSNNRVDFKYYDFKKYQFVLGEVGNNYDNELDLIDKLIQCNRYHQLFPSYQIVLFLPIDYIQHNGLLDYLSKYYKITIKRIKIHDIVTNYDEFYKIIYPNYFDELQPNIGYFKKY